MLQFEKEKEEETFMCFIIWKLFFFLGICFFRLAILPAAGISREEKCFIIYNRSKKNKLKVWVLKNIERQDEGDNVLRCTSVGKNFIKIQLNKKKRGRKKRSILSIKILFTSPLYNLFQD